MLNAPLTTLPYTCPPLRTPRTPQRGVVLIVALVMLVVIGIASVAVMRNVMDNDLVSENNRRQSQAMQAAQTALRYCEESLAVSAMTPAAATTEATETWRTFTTWTGTAGTLANGGPVNPPASFLNSASSQTSRYSDSAAENRSPLPQCMAQRRTPAGGGSVIVVTARGFSDNYVADATTGNTEAGAVVWLQSIIQF